MCLRIDHQWGLWRPSTFRCGPTGFFLLFFSSFINSLLSVTVSRIGCMYHVLAIIGNRLVYSITYFFNWIDRSYVLVSRLV
ncbi:hypothetical protein BX600DRAFT_446011 [Xylariales sp. PMI_506]|nr:hypothetical protein BX600DRAFT_446011 [Xylariales sp. PMI_506]